MDGTSASSTLSQTDTLAAWRIWLPRIAILIVVALGIYFAADLGVRWRYRVWETTAHLHFSADIDRDYQWGRTAAAEGFLNQYEKMQLQLPADANWLDEPPLGLGVMTLWGKWSIKHFPAVNSWSADHSYALTAPMLHFNLCMEAVGVVCAFLLARLWYIRGKSAIGSTTGDTSLRWFFRGWIPGILAALLLWFNPAVVISAYGWPSWDLWIVPMFLLAAFLASADWWFTAGLVLGIGAMLKGQQLVALPVFVLWSMVLGRPVRTFQLCAGATLAIALIALPWLISYIPADKLAAARAIQTLHGQAYQAPADTFKMTRTTDLPALIWILGVLVAASVAPWIGWLQLRETTLPPPRWRKVLSFRWSWRIIAAFTTMALVMWPWWISRNHAEWFTGLTAAIALAIAVLMVRPRGIYYLSAAALGFALLMCMSVFHGSSAWYDCGFHYGTVHWPVMNKGMTDNLPAILSKDFGWPMDDIDTTAVTIPAHVMLSYPGAAVDVSMKQLLLTLFLAALLLCGLGAGIHARRNDPRILIALTGCWLAFFCFPPQIQGQYLLFAAGISCICTGVSIGMTLLGVFLSSVAGLMTLHEMLAAAGWDNLRRFSKALSEQYPSMFTINTGSKLLSTLAGTHPDLGYAVILCTLIFLYFSLAVRAVLSTGVPAVVKDPAGMK